MTSNLHPTSTHLNWRLSESTSPKRPVITGPSSFETFDDMKPRCRLHNLRDLSGLQGHGSLLEFFLHIIFAEEAPGSNHATRLAK